jgi:hypothetical protein
LHLISCGWKMALGYSAGYLWSWFVRCSLSINGCFCRISQRIRQFLDVEFGLVAPMPPRHGLH